MQSSSNSRRSTRVLVLVLLLSLIVSPLWIGGGHCQLNPTSGIQKLMLDPPSHKTTNTSRDEVIHKWRASLLPWEFATNQAFSLNTTTTSQNITISSHKKKGSNASILQRFRTASRKRSTYTSKTHPHRSTPLSPIYPKSTAQPPITVNQTVFKFVLFDTLYQFIVALWSLKTFLDTQRSGNLYRPRIPRQHYTFEVWNDRYQKDIMAYDHALLPSEALRAQLDRRVQALQKKRQQRQRKKGESTTTTNNDLHPRQRQNTTVVIEVKTNEQLSLLPDIVSFLLTAFHHRQTVHELLGSDIEILVLLESPGGSVATYGYLASQLARLRSNPTAIVSSASNTTTQDETAQAEITTKLTICCDRIAASGGYLMACQADWLLAAPFAIIGSIGVYKEGMNVKDLLEKFGIRPQLVSSGKYKTLWHEYANNPTKEELQHLQKKEDATLDAFKIAILSLRSTKITNIDKVATGEVWLGMEAIELGLVDEIQTSDE
jgi:ClpP class serine protease